MNSEFLSKFESIEHRLTSIETILKGALAGDGITHRIKTIEKKQFVLFLLCFSALTARVGLDTLLKFI